MEKYTTNDNNVKTLLDIINDVSPSLVDINTSLLVDVSGDTNGTNNYAKKLYYKNVDLNWEIDNLQPEVCVSSNPIDFTVVPINTTGYNHVSNNATVTNEMSGDANHMGGHANDMGDNAEASGEYLS